MQAIAISVGGLVLGWIVYDGMCKSPLGRNDTTLALVGYVFLVALAWGFTRCSAVVAPTCRWAR